MRDKLSTMMRLLSTLALAVTAGACGPSGSTVCTAKCDCEGCSEVEYDACVSDAEGDLKESDFRDCGPEYDDYLSCEDATGFCKGSKFETSCGAERDRWKACVEVGKKGH